MLPFVLFAILAAVGPSAVTVATKLPDKIYGVNIGSWWVQSFDIWRSSADSHDQASSRTMDAS